MYSAEILELAKERATIEATGIKMALPSYESLLVTWDKRKTHDFFKAHNIPYPKTHTQDVMNDTSVKFPLFIKAVSGSGSKNATKIENWVELAVQKDKIGAEHIVQDHIGGEEYTIDALGDLTGKMVAASPRLRLKIDGGLAVKSITVASPLLVRYTKKIVETLKLVGPVNIQCKIENGKPYFIEINSRLPSGGLPLTVAAGFNIPLLTIKMLLGMPLGKINIKKGLMMIRYWDALITDKAGKKLHGFSHQFV
jgi:carbamoyl-phosphate synthase large subunit